MYDLKARLDKCVSATVKVVGDVETARSVCSQAVLASRGYKPRRRTTRRTTRHNHKRSKSKSR